MQVHFALLVGELVSLGERKGQQRGFPPFLNCCVSSRARRAAVVQKPSRASRSPDPKGETSLSVSYYMQLIDDLGPAILGRRLLMVELSLKGVLLSLLALCLVSFTGCLNPPRPQVELKVAGSVGLPISEAWAIASAGDNVIVSGSGGPTGTDWVIDPHTGNIVGQHPGGGWPTIACANNVIRIGGDPVCRRLLLAGPGEGYVWGRSFSYSSERQEVPLVIAIDCYSETLFMLGEFEDRERDIWGIFSAPITPVLQLQNTPWEAWATSVYTFTLPEDVSPFGITSNATGIYLGVRDFSNRSSVLHNVQIWKITTGQVEHKWELNLPSEFHFRILNDNLASTDKSLYILVDSDMGPKLIDVEIVYQVKNRGSL